MAKHILEKGEHPLFFYGTHFNGGGSIEGHLGALAIIAGGYSDISLKFVALFISLLIVGFLFLWGKEKFGFWTGAFAAYLYVFSISYVSWNLKLWGHMTGVLLMLVLLWLYYRFLFQGRRGWIMSLVTGLFSGLAVWCTQSNLIVIFLFLVFWFNQDRKLLAKGKFWAMAGMFTAGLTPVIYQSFASNFMNLRQFFFKAPHWIEARGFFDRILLTFTHDLPSLFHSDIVHNYPKSLGWMSWTSYAIVMTAVVFFALNCWKPLKDWLRNWLKPRGELEANPEGMKLLFIVFFIIIFQAIFTFSKYCCLSPRYLMPILPGLFLVTAYCLKSSIGSKSIPLRIFGVAALVLWGIIGVRETLTVSKPRTVDDGYWEPPGEDMVRLVEALRKQNIEGGYANMFIKSRIIFYSGEDIIISRFRNPRGERGVLGIPPIMYYPEYEVIVENMEAESRKIAYIFAVDNPIWGSVEDYLAEDNIEYKVGSEGYYRFYYDFNPKFHHRELTKFLFMHGEGFDAVNGCL